MESTSVVGVFAVAVPVSGISTVTSGSSCANCSGNLTTTCVAYYAFTESKLKLTVFQGLNLVFRGQEVSSETAESNCHRLCSPCGLLFGKLLKLYKDFRCVSTTGSFVDNLVSQQAGREEMPIAVDEYVEIANPDNDDGIMNNVFEEYGTNEPTLLPPLPESNVNINASLTQEYFVITQTQLESHEEIVNLTEEEIQWFRCEQCPMSYKSHTALSIHESKKHHRGQPLPPSENDKLLFTSEYKCDICPAVFFSSMKEWVIHHQTEHEMDMGYGNLDTQELLVPVEGQYRPCPTCGKIWKRRKDLLIHIKYVHINFRAFCCEICDKKFRTTKLLQNHVSLVHENIAPQFLCTLCGTALRSKRSLVYHESTHFSEPVKRYECDICHSKFVGTVKLKEHKLTAHSEERPFACDQCNGRYKLMAHLRIHKLKSHKKKFILDEVCGICGKAYAFKLPLKIHLMSLHKFTEDEARRSAKMKIRSLLRVLPNGEQAYKEIPNKKPRTCEFCQRSYVSRERLFLHIMSTHGKSEEEAKQVTQWKSKRILLPRVGERARRKTPSLTNSKSKQTKDSISRLTFLHQ